MKSSFKKCMLPVVLLGMLALTLACTSAAQRSRRLLASGDHAGALEQLAPALTRKPDDKEAGALFVQIYPSIVESLKSDAGRLKASAAGDTVMSARLVETLEQLVRIQRAVLPMPVQIGSRRAGYVGIEKYADNFTEQLADAKLVAAAAWYDQAGRNFPGQNRIEKEALIRQYETVFAYVADYRDSRERIARLAYEVADDYELRATIPDLRKAVEWLGTVERWVTNYLDSSGRRQMLSHRLGQLLKAEGTVAAYDEAYQYFRLAGNYDNAAAEVQLYDFNRKVLQLPNEIAGTTAVLRGGADSGGPRLSLGPVQHAGDNPFAASRVISLQTSRFSHFSQEKHGIHPGAVFAGAGLPDGLFRPVTADRSPLLLSLFLEGQAEAVDILVSDPGQADRTQSAIRLAIEQSGTPLPRLDWRFEVLSDPDSLPLALGFGYGKERLGLAGRPAASELFRDKNITYSLLELRLVSHTVTIDEPRLPAEFFAARGTAIAAPTQLGSHAPYYVSRQEYGQQVWLVLASSLAAAELQQRLAAFLKSLDPRELAADSAFRIVDQFALDGRPVAIRDTAGLAAWLRNRLEAPAAPAEIQALAFQLRSLKDNSLAVLRQETEITQAVSLRLTVVPVALQLDSGEVSQLLLNAYASGGQQRPANPSRDPESAGASATGWQAALGSGEVFVALEGKAGPVRWLVNNSLPYTSLATSFETPVFVGLKAGYRTASGALNWLPFQYLQLKVSDILRDSAAWRTLRDEGLYFSGPDFAGRLYFDIRLDPAH